MGQRYNHTKMKNLEDLEYDDSPERPSKSQRKRDMQALQDMGAELVELSPERLARIDMPDALRGAIREAQRLTRHEARRRQLQYIGRLMRDADPAPIREALDAVKGVSAIENARQHRLEKLRERLLEDEAVLTEIGTINRLHKNNVEQAGFAVLKAPDIPSILIETAFISNPEEEKKLNNPKYQDKMAESIVSGIRKYFQKNPPLAKPKRA